MITFWSSIGLPTEKETLRRSLTGLWRSLRRPQSVGTDQCSPWAETNYPRWHWRWSCQGLEKPCINPKLIYHYVTTRAWFRWFWIVASTINFKIHSSLNNTTTSKPSEGDSNPTYDWELSAGLSEQEDRYTTPAGITGQPSVSCFAEQKKTCHTATHDNTLTIFMPFSHHFHAILPSFSHHFPNMFASFPHHFPITFPSFSHHFLHVFPSAHHFSICNDKHSTTSTELAEALCVIPTGRLLGPGLDLGEFSCKTTMTTSYNSILPSGK